MANFTPLGVEAVVKGLGQFTSDLGKMDKSIDETGKKAGSIGSEFGKLGEGVLKFGSLAAGAVVGGVGALVGGLSALTLKTAANADALVELSDKTGISTTRLQELQYIGGQTGTSMETVTGSMARLVRSMDSATKAGSPAAEAFKTLGINVLDANGGLRNSQEVFGEALDALSKMTNPTERDAAAMAIFGRSAQELNPLIKLGAEGMDEMAKKAHELGGVLSEEAIQSSADFNDKLADLKLTFGGAAAQLGSTLIPVVSGLIDKYLIPAIPVIQGLVTAFGNWITTVGAPALMTAIDAIGKFLSDLITNLGPVANQVLGFMAANWETIKGALLGIGAVLAGAGIVALISGIVTALGAILSPIGLIIAAAALLGAAWSTNFLGIRDTLIMVWETYLLPALTKIWEWLSVNIPIAIQTASDFWTNTLLPALQTAAAWIQENVIPVIQRVVAWLQENIPVAIQKASDFWNNTLLPALRSVANWIAENVIPVIQRVVAWLQENIPIAIQKASDFWNNTLLPALRNAWQYFSEKILPIIQDVIDIAKTLGEIALVALAKFWNETLLPALRDVWKFFNENVLPILRDVRDFIVDEIGPKVTWFADKVLTPLANTLREGVGKAIDFVKGLLDDLLQKLLDFKAKLKGIPILGNSPSPLEISLLGIGSAAQTAAAGIDTLGKALEKVKADKVFDIGGAFGSLGSAAVSRFQKQTVDPLKARLDEIEDLKKKSLDLLQSGNLPPLVSEQMILDEIMRLEAERVALAEEYAAAQKKVLDLQKQQEDLAFLKQQMDFLKMIKENNLDLTSILGGLQLGLDVSLPDLIAAMTRAIQAMVAKAQEELGAHSPSTVFANIGRSIMQGLAGGISGALGAPLASLQTSLTALTAAPRMSAPSIVRQQSVTIGPNNFSDGMDLALLSGMVERALVGGLE